MESDKAIAKEIERLFRATNGEGVTLQHSTCSDGTQCMRLDINELNKAHCNHMKRNGYRFLSAEAAPNARVSVLFVKRVKA